MLNKTTFKLLLHPLLFLFSSLGICQESLSLRENLKIVNNCWSKPSLNITFDENLSSTLNEVQLIELHFKHIERILRGKIAADLTAEQKNKRLFCLDKLEEYRKRRTFPKNTFHKKRTPYFVDLFGTHCAVAYLMKETGADQLIAKIKETHNYSYIDELAKEYDEEILKWANEYGFSIEELEWIQPNYGVIHQEVLPMGNGGGANGEVTTMEISPDESALYLAGNFTIIDGVEANSIVGWTGSEWFTLGAGVEGSISDIHFHNNLLYIIGNFKTPGAEEYSSIAYWHNETWIAVTEYSGNIYAIETYQDRLYVGGSFQYLDGKELPYLAYYDETLDCWSNSSYVYENGELVSLPGIFTVNGIVRTFAVYEDQLFVGGDFTYTSPNVSHPNLLHYDVTGYARWFGYIWIASAEVNMPSVNLLVPTDDELYIIGPFTAGYPSLINYNNGAPYDEGVLMWTLNDDKPPLVHGHLHHNDNLFFYGNLKIGGMFLGNGLFYFDAHMSSGEFDDQITAATSFKGYLYFAGDFTIAFDDPFNGLARSLWGGEPVATKEPKEKVDLHLYTSEKHLHIKSKKAIGDSRMNIYDLNGQLHKSILLNEHSNKTIIDLQDLANGLYAFHFISPAIRKSKILPVF